MVCLGMWCSSRVSRNMNLCGHGKVTTNGSRLSAKTHSTMEVMKFRVMTVDKCYVIFVALVEDPITKFLGLCQGTLVRI